MQKRGESFGDAVGISIKNDDLRIIVDGKEEEVWTSGRLYKILDKEGPLGVIWELVSYYPVEADHALREIVRESGINLENVPFYLTKGGRLRADSEWSEKSKPRSAKLPEEIGVVDIDTSGVSVLINPGFARDTLLQLLANHIEGAVVFEDGGGRSVP
jgi:hypothetical protein